MRLGLRNFLSWFNIYIYNLLEILKVLFLYYINYKKREKEREKGRGRGRKEYFLELF